MFRGKTEAECYCLKCMRPEGQATARAKDGLAERLLRDALSALSKTIPHARHIELAGLDHNAPDNDAPERIAGELSRFLKGNSESG